MKCEICNKEFVEDEFVLTKYLTHKIIFHGATI
jgi:hypothetical protein